MEGGEGGKRVDQGMESGVLHGQKGKRGGKAEVSFTLGGKREEKRKRKSTHLPVVIRSDRIRPGVLLRPSQRSLDPVFPSSTRPFGSDGRARLLPEEERGWEVLSKGFLASAEGAASLVEETGGG